MDAYYTKQGTVNYTTKSTVSIVKPDGLVSYEVREIVVTANILFGEIVGLLGIVANVINVVVFSKIGFSDTVNISLAALAVSDVGALVTLQWFNVIVNPWFLQLDLPFLPLEIQSLTAGYPHNYFVKVTGFITAFVAFERCLCVTLPFKVKTLITKRIALAFNVAVFFVIALTMFPVYYTAYYDWKFDAKKNKTVLGIFYTKNINDVLGPSLFLTNSVVPLVSFAVIILCNIVIAFRLKRASVWRQMSSGAAITTPGAAVSVKEKKMVKMIVIVSVIFIICFIPSSALLTARAIIPELSISGIYSNINWIVATYALEMETVNSSITIVVYYRMSSKYRETLLVILGRHVNTKKTSSTTLNVSQRTETSDLNSC
ncbi:G-protein coupled receptor C02B8.5 [Biomphalaria pfeifferi]|uniref:G-protein coupled receptor C02B8.5 n=1 Tax=Biomphalaria pfeifferi TaxID=112525 RepID=A0AAD8FKQ6_BIOPF|nr:G-protein coupled receptor C02B8.5 [Biomphalaria pfeifferi]